MARAGRRADGRRWSTIPESPLAAACDIVLPICAGPERSVAATKTFVASLAALLRLVAAGPRTTASPPALDRLPERLAARRRARLERRARPARRGGEPVVIGRGPTLAIAREAALKLKEVANLHAEAFSGAEFLHGPVALVAARYPILVLMPTDAAAAGIAARWSADLAARARRCSRPRRDGALPVARARPSRNRRGLPDPELLCDDCRALAARLGIDTDRPRHLQKVTRTR